MAEWVNLRTLLCIQGNKLTVKASKTIYKVRHWKKKEDKEKEGLPACFQLNSQKGDVGRFACLAWLTRNACFLHALPFKFWLHVHTRALLWGEWGVRGVTFMEGLLSGWPCTWDASALHPSLQLIDSVWTEQAMPMDGLKLALERLRVPGGSSILEASRH